MLLGADPQHCHDERVAEAHHDDWKRKQNDQLVPGECDSLEVAVKVAVCARHDRHVAGIVVVEHVPRILRFVYTCIVIYRTTTDFSGISQLVNSKQLGSQKSRSVKIQEVY